MLERLRDIHRRAVGSYLCLDFAHSDHTVKYVITKQGGNITLDCTDFEGEDVNWIRMGGKTHTLGKPPKTS